MREIKFRVWDVKNKEFIRWWLSLMDGDTELNELFQKPHPYGESFDYDFQQYTGVKDINGVDVYEGDIVETIYNNNECGEVQYVDTLSSFRIRTSNGLSIPLTTLRWKESEPNVGVLVPTFTKVVGNIYNLTEPKS